MRVLPLFLASIVALCVFAHADNNTPPAPINPLMPYPPEYYPPWFIPPPATPTTQPTPTSRFASKFTHVSRPTYGHDDLYGYYHTDSHSLCTSGCILCEHAQDVPPTGWTSCSVNETMWLNTNWRSFTDLYWKYPLQPDWNYLSVIGRPEVNPIPITRTYELFAYPDPCFIPYVNASVEYIIANSAPDTHNTCATITGSLQSPGGYWVNAVTENWKSTSGNDEIWITVFEDEFLPGFCGKAFFQITQHRGYTNDTTREINPTFLRYAFGKFAAAAAACA